MTPKDKMQVTKEEIQNLGLDSIKNYLVVDPSDFDKETLIHLLHKAKIGMQFEREMNLNNRSMEMNSIRIVRLTAETKEEMKKQIKASLPHYFK